MKIVQSSFFRAICSIIIGVLLLRYPDNTVTWITLAIGIMFLLSGVFSTLAYLNARKNSSDYVITDIDGRVISKGKPTFPLVGVGSIILGVMLVTSPSVFVEILMYIMGGILILGSLNQFMSLYNARRWGKMAWGFWVAPSLILLAGLYVMFQPMEAASMPMVVIGWCCLLYGASEVVNATKINLKKKGIDKADIVEKESEEEVK
ncbi:MAG: DUF308 domain-containing protein [Prevotella sp.]|nr:DUF308 domain-containing protein [Prevotella sp.]